MKIATVSDCPSLCTGLARVHRNVIDGLADAGHEVLPCCWFAYDTNTLTRMKMGDPAPELWHTTPSGTKLQMAAVPKRNNMNEVKAMFDVIEMAKPDLVLTIGDYIDFYYMQALKIKKDFSFKWAAYLTIELEEIDERLAPIFKYADVLIAPTQFGKKVLEKHADCPVFAIPYGVDSRFVRLPEADRKRLREERGLKEGQVRFITVAQNTMRKNLPVLMQAVAEVGKNASEWMRFYLHTNIDECDPQEASIYALRKLADKLGVSHMFEFPKEPVSIFAGAAEDKLVEEYNASDFFVTPTLSEGFGLPIVEAMACGLPCIASDASCMPEHMGKKLDGYLLGMYERGYLAQTRTQVYAPDNIVQVPKPESIASGLIYAAATVSGSETARKSLEDMRKSCQNYAKGLSWDSMKRSLCTAIGAAATPPAIPVEIV